ncbi:hypothetical protein [Nocardia sp. NPDC055049]
MNATAANIIATENREAHWILKGMGYDLAEAEIIINTARKMGESLGDDKALAMWGRIKIGR